MPVAGDTGSQSRTDFLAPGIHHFQEPPMCSNLIRFPRFQYLRIANDQILDSL